ncbi:MAG TPA: DEAD/DEAH box helicase [Nocardioidaceae bacterium]|nr:DEAD/DEAH box helicase [Nocardioidaceae bacterium]
MPSLDLLLHDANIVAVVGAAAFGRGSSYAQSGRVLSLEVDEIAGSLSAKVLGSGGNIYRTTVSIEPGLRQGSLALDTSCSCPVAIDCKHAAALMITARQRLSSSRPPAEAREGTLAAWELALAPVVTPPEEAGERGAPMALELEVVETAPSPPRVFGRGAAPPAPARRVRLRPLAMGKSGKWVRSGTSWRDLAFGYGSSVHLAEHRAVLREMYNVYRSTDGYFSMYDDNVYLDLFGPSWWRVLEQAVGSGVELVRKPRSQGEVVVAEQPVAVALDLRRDADRSGVRVAPRVTMGERDLPADRLDLVGSPPHGVVLHGPRELVLGRLDRPLRPAVATLLGGASLHVPDEDVERLLVDFIPRLRRAVPVVSSDDTVRLPEVSAPRLAVTVRYSNGHRLAVEWQWEYSLGEHTRRFPLDGADPDELRDRAAEQDIVQRVYTGDDLVPRLCGTMPGRRQPLPTVLLGGMDAVLFVDEALPRLLEHPDVVVHEHGERPDFRAAENEPVVELTTSDSTDPDWFDLGVKVSVDGEQIPLEDLIRALAQDATHMVLPSGTWLRIDRPELHRLRQLIEEARALQDRPAGQLRLSPYQAGFWHELVELGVVAEQSQRWSAVVDGLTDVQLLEPPPAPASLEASLRPYQLEGFQWLSFLMDHRLGGILADDMGLGKTLQTLAVLCRAKESGRLDGPVLVVAPTSVVGNWAAEAARFAPGLGVVTVTETAQRRGVPLEAIVAGADVVVTSYALFRIGYEEFAATSWSGLVLDEAQFVKNHQAKTYQCARRLPAPFKLAITGTPLENNLMDLWALLSIVAPGLFPSPQRFTEFYRTPIERGGAPELLATLRRRIRPLMRRRTKEQVAADLPPKQEQVVEVALTGKHRRIYETHLARERQKVLGLIGDLDKNRFTILKSLTLLRQLSLAPSLVDGKYAGVDGAKIDVLLEKLVEVTGEGHRALVFSQFTGFLGRVRDRLDAEGIGYAYLDGRTLNRARVIDGFKDGDVPVFLISLKAGGFGLNLTEADYCFVLDPWWNPATEAQAVDRTHRIGQDKTVVVYRLVSKDTIEEKVMALKERKSALFQSVLEEDALLSAPLSVDDIRGLLGA